MQETSKIVLVLLLAVSGCGQHQPKATADETTLAPVPTPAALMTEAAIEAAESVKDQAVVDEPTPSPTPSVSAPFQGYTRAWQDFQQAPTPSIPMSVEGIPDPASINASLNDMNQRVMRLKAEQDAIPPAQRKAFRLYRKELQEEGE